ncbi:MAG: TIGR04219 family outer membrane beta-barrel protein [Campylobacterota bacterium]|nr:TIGR04219 family outer membrane beta-barrel protein [Campylobacterota bacterium]
MKKLLTAAAMTAMIGTAAHADFTRVEAGVGSWQSDPSGPLTYSVSGVTETVDIVDNLGFQEENFTYLWLNIKHPIPILPNLRLEKVDVDFSGKATQDFTWVVDGTEHTYSADTVSNLQIDQTDIILYYNILDNTAWTTVDLGVDVKLMDLTVDVTDSVGGSSYSESESVPLPMAYLRGRVEVPATNLGIEGDIKYISYSDSKMYDARVKVDYTLDFVPVVQPALEVGYRVQKLDIDEDDLDVKVDVEFSGFYAGLMLRF